MTDDPSPEKPTEFENRVDSLIKSIPRPENIPAKQFNAIVEDLFNRIMLMVDNAGTTDEHRALN
jgi:hypothetical protein